MKPLGKPIIIGERMQLTEEQAMKAISMLSEALELVLYAYDKDIVVDDDMIESLRKIVLGSKELLSE
ncbi:hypothetical protein D3C72_410950 [compost metagenome]